jgi:hypothetical protein
LKFKRWRALNRIEDFIDKKITHLAVFGYGAPKVATFDEAMRDFEYGRFSNDIKLLCLFGKSNGDLEWRVNQYYDGSGSWKEVIPCQSEAEALTAVKEHTEKPRGDVMQWAFEFGVPVSQEYAGAVREQRRKALEAEVGKAKGNLAEAEHKLATL